jgi:hypothetical protein
MRLGCTKKLSSESIDKLLHTLRVRSRCELDRRRGGSTRFVANSMTAGSIPSKTHLERRLYRLPFARNKLLPVSDDFCDFHEQRVFFRVKGTWNDVFITYRSRETNYFRFLKIFRFRRKAGIFLSIWHLELRFYHLPFSRNKLLPVFENFSISTKSGYFSEQKALGTTSLSLTVLEKQTTSGF